MAYRQEEENECGRIELKKQERRFWHEIIAIHVIARRPLLFKEIKKNENFCFSQTEETA